MKKILMAGLTERRRGAAVQGGGVSNSPAARTHNSFCSLALTAAAWAWSLRHWRNNPS